MRFEEKKEKECDDLRDEEVGGNIAMKFLMGLVADFSAFAQSKHNPKKEKES